MKKEEKAILEAVQNEDIVTVKEYINNPKSDISFRYNMLTQEAAETGNLELFLLFYNDSRVDLSDLDNYVFKSAAKSNNIKIFNLLIHLDLSYYNFFDALKMAFKNKNITMLKKILYDKRFFSVFKEKNQKGFDTVNLLIKENKIEDF